MMSIGQTVAELWRFCIIYSLLMAMLRNMDTVVIFAFT